MVHSRMIKLCFNTSDLGNSHCKCIYKTILLCYRSYTTNHRFYYKTYIFLLSTVHLSIKIIREIKQITLFSLHVRNADNYWSCSTNSSIFIV